MEQSSVPVFGAIEALMKEDQNIFYKLNEVQEDLKKVTCNIASINTQFEEVKTQNKQTCESVTEIKKECAHLQDWVLAMSAEINDQQRTRKNNLIISEVPLTKSENVYEILAYLAHLINFKFLEEIYLWHINCR